MRPERKKVPRHVVRDDGGRDPILLQFPSRQPSPLQKRPRLVGEHVDLFPRLHRRANHAQRRPIPRRRQRPRIAMRQHRLAIRHQRRPMPPDRHAQGDVFLPHLLRFLDHPLHDNRRG